MINKPKDTHRFRDLLGDDASRVFRISFKDGDVLRLAECQIVDPTIYSISDQWTATLVEQAQSRSSRLFRPGMGIDFVESDIVEIYDETLERRVYLA